MDRHAGSQPQRVVGSLNYVKRPDEPLYWYSAMDPPPGKPRTNHVLEAHEVEIENMRELPGGTDLDVQGFELVSFWRPRDWLALDLVYTRSRARLDSPEEDAGFIGRYIEGSVEQAGELGFSILRGPWEVSSRLRYLGPYPLLPDDSQRASAQKVVNLRAAWKSAHVLLYGEWLNVFDNAGKDITYYYPTHFTGFDPPGVEVNGRVSRPAEPRTLRAGIQYRF